MLHFIGGGHPDTAFGSERTLATIGQSCGLDSGSGRHMMALLRSVKYALNGLGFVLKTQRNARIHLVMACVVVLAGVMVGLAVQDWLWLTAAITLVWFAEVMNTGFEYLCDVVSPGYSESVKRAKDIAAGAVLICVVFAVWVGGMVFIPHLTAGA